jgi:hypothetical protein
MQVPDAYLLQGDFITAVFKNSIQYTVVGTLKSWDQGESDYQTLYVTTMPYYLQIHTHVCLALKMWHAKLHTCGMSWVRISLKMLSKTVTSKSLLEAMKGE